MNLDANLVDIIRSRRHSVKVLIDLASLWEIFESVGDLMGGGLTFFCGRVIINGLRSQGLSTFIRS